MNVGSLINNWNIFSTSRVRKADIICIQETWYIKNVNMVRLKGFNKLEYTCRTNGRGGGVGIYVKEGIHFEKIDTPFNEKIIETIGVKIRIGATLFNIISAYRNPSPLGEGLDILYNWLVNQENETKDNIIILGDLNVNMLKNTPLSRKLKLLKATHGLKSHTKGITRITSRTSIDHALSNTISNLTRESKILD